MVDAPPALTPPPGNPRFPLFDGLRAMAALAVLVFHAAYYSRASQGDGGLSPYLAQLNVGVAVFFVISGFLLYRPLLAARLGHAPPVKLRDYARRRFLRIVPAYWVAVTLLAIYPGLPEVFSSRWWIFYGFGQDYGTRVVVDGIGPAWTLGCEVVFYALLPFLSLTLAWGAGLVGRKVWWQAELVALAALALASGLWRAFTNSHPSVPPSTFATTFAWFALGMALALASAVWITPRRRAVGVFERYAWVGWLVALGAYLIICRGLGLGTGFVFFQRTTTAQDLAVYTLSGVVAVGLVLPAVFESVPRSRLGRLLASPTMTWLGVVSYGIYLYHQPIADALGGGINSGGDATVRFLWLAAATAALAIGVAALSYYLVERPALKFKERRLVGGRAPGRPAPPAPRPTPPPPASPPASANPSPAAHERHT
jgi:peptidoglycan/LPS O-acetylase OafA/YrhL